MDAQYQASVTQATVGEHADLTITVDRRLRVDSGGGTAGSPSGGVQSVQGVDSGTPLAVTNGGITVPITPTLTNGAAYTTGKLLFATTALANAVRVVGGRSYLTGIVLSALPAAVIPPDMELWFFDATQTLGALNADPSVDSAIAASIVGHVDVAASDFHQWTGSNNYIATLDNLNIKMTATGASTSLWVAGIARGSVTWATANPLRLKAKFEYIS
jgi:hypothetical protein